MYSRPMGGQQSRTAWGTGKGQRTLSVTDEAWELWTQAAIKAEVNRSDLFETLARVAGQMDIPELRRQLVEEKNYRQSTPA